MAKADVRVVLISVSAAALVVACSGGGNGPSVTPMNPMNASGGFARAARSAALPKAERGRQRIALDRTGKAVTLPSVAGMTERITLPSNDAQPGASLEVTVSTALPPSLERLPARESMGFLSIALEASADVAFHGIPKFSLRLRSRPPNHGAFYAWTFSAQRGWRDFGPMTVSGNVLTFGGSRKNLKLQRGIVYDVVPFTAVASQGCPGAVLFVANSANNTVTEYAPPYTGEPVATISNSLSAPAGLAFDASGDLFVANSGNNTVTEYASPYKSAPIATIAIGPSSPFGPFGLAFDASGNLFVSNSQAGSVTEYASPYTGAPIATISNGLSGPAGLAFDASDNLFVANNLTQTPGTVTEYASPYTGAPIAAVTIGLNAPLAVAFDASENLFVSNQIGGGISEYVAPYTGAPIATILSNGATGLAFDTNDNLFVANFGESRITEYAPPYTGAPIATNSNGVQVPSGLAFGP